MIAQRWLGATFLVSGAAAIAGALLPWLTVYAGLYQYGGTVGLYGRIVLGVGVAAILASLATVRMRNSWLACCGVVFGFGLLAFSAWLYAGLVEIADICGYADRDLDGDGDLANVDIDVLRNVVRDVGSLATSDHVGMAARVPIG